MTFKQRLRAWFRPQADSPGRLVPRANDWFWDNYGGNPPCWSQLAPCRDCPQRATQAKDGTWCCPNQRWGTQ